MKHIFIILPVLILGFTMATLGQVEDGDTPPLKPSNTQTLSSASVPQTISYQGLLTDSARVPLNGSYDLTFTLYSPETGELDLWVETFKAVPVTNGTFTVILGSTNPLDAFLFTLPLTVGVTVGANDEFSPRTPLTSAPYALAPWLPSPSGIAYYAGNVGIGIENPSTKLEVFQTDNTLPVASFIHEGASSKPLISAVNLNRSRLNTGLGVGTQFRLLNSLGNSQEYGYVGGVIENNTFGSADGGVVIATTGAGIARNERVRVTGSGNVGIGTANPQRRLVVEFDTPVPTTNTAFSNPNTTNNSAVVQSFRTNTTGSGAQTFLEVAAISAVTTEHNNATRNTDLHFYTDNATGGLGDRLTILGSGSVGIGTTSPAAKLHVNGSAGNNTGTWSNLSDRRLKKEIEPIEDALGTVTKLNGVTFRWKDEAMDTQYGRVRGLIAQEVEDVIPEWIKTDPDGYKRIEPIGVDALLIEAIKEQQKEIDSQNRVIEDLGAMVKSLAEKISSVHKQSLGELK